MSSERQDITLVVDGVEVEAAEGSMLVDAAKHGDVEIPVFCYEPKLGAPVGACRMCLVEIEGIPKLQTACSTPVRDGMVVYTQTDRVKAAQEAVVEFLLVNHPLDCPVCDKGGECPLQDIAMGWGPGRSRVIDPKRHFQKPLPLSPLVKIDRERCILCYRCVRFSQEVAEDEQLQLLERGAATFVGTFDDRPYVAPFHGNVIELCPVGALTSEAYRFRARPWDIEDAGSICTLCPSQCNVKFTVRDEQVKRVLARDNAEVDDGWLCDKGRWGFEMMNSAERIAQPLVRRGGSLEPVSWSEALDAAAKGLREAGERTGALLGGGTSNEEGYLVQRIVRGALGSPHVDSRPGGGATRAQLVELFRPECAAGMADIEAADTVLVVGCDPLHEMPILDLRIRKAIRREGTRLAVASARPTSLDGGAEEAVLYGPGDEAAFLAALAAKLGGEDSTDAYGEEANAVAKLLGEGSTVIVWSERMLRGDAGSSVATALLHLANTLGAAADGSGLLAVPESANGRGLREVGCLPDAGPGLSEAAGGRATPAIRSALEANELSAAIVWDADPVREGPDGPGWAAALHEADFVLAVSMFENASTAHADVIFPAETHAEKEGTVTHPDGRLQRLRPGVPHPGAVRPLWEVLAELAARLGDETGIDSAPEALDALASDVPFYAGITHEEIGGDGIRWQERDEASYPEAPGVAPADTKGAAERAEGADQVGATEVSDGAMPGDSDGASVQIGTYRDLWATDVTEHSPALRFLAPDQVLELAPADAERLGVTQGDEVDVRSNGTSLRARVTVRERMREGAGFMIEGTAAQNANALADGQAVEVAKAAEDSS
jgi:NADH-quinone oxidoreductase subunit G